MSEPRDVVDDKFDEAAALPPAPRLPHAGRSIAETIDRMGIARFLEGLESTISADHRQRIEETKATNHRIEQLANDVRDGFKRVIDALAVIERHEKQLSEHRRDINAHDDQLDDLRARVARHDKQLAEHAETFAKLETAAAKRLKRR